MKSDERQIAYFGLGCFWEPDEELPKLTGVIETEVGYCGGDLPKPTYENLGDHTETVKVAFNPQKITYPELLQAFWAMHDSTVKQKTQYRSVIFYCNDDQKREAEMVWLEEQERQAKPILTKVEPFKKFWRAEAYHQKYLAKQRHENS